MKFSPALTEVVEVLSPGTVVDPYSSYPVESWDSPTVREVSGVLVYMGSATEESTARNPDQSFTQLNAILPYGDPITRRDRLRVLTGLYAGTYTVDGTPAHWRTPWTGWEGGTQVRLSEVSGV